MGADVWTLELSTLALTQLVISQELEKRLIASVAGARYVNFAKELR